MTGMIQFPCTSSISGYAAKFDSARDIANRNCSESEQFCDYEGAQEECGFLS
jgi:hypothetical protein